jgi:chromosome segregation ATPase
MNSWRYLFALVIGITLLVQGCFNGESSQLKLQIRQIQEQSSQINTELSKAQDSLVEEQKKNAELFHELQLMKEKSAQKESHSEKSVESDSDSSVSRADKPEVQGLDKKAKIQILGEKALTQYKLARLNERLDTLNKDLSLKQRQMESLESGNNEKALVIERLTGEIAELSERNEKRTRDLQGELDKTIKDLENQSSSLEKTKRQLAEITTRNRELEGKLSETASLKETIEGKLGDVQSKLVGALQQVDKLSSEAAAARKTAERFREEHEKSRAEVDAARKDSQVLKAQLDELVPKLQALEASVRQAQGDSSIERILQQPLTGGKAAVNSPY